MPRWMLAALAVLLGSALSLPAMAQWKWRDQQGHTQYSDLPPPLGTPDKDILQRPSGASARAAPMAPASAASGAPLLAPRASDPELEAKRKKAEQDAIDKKKADDAKNAAINAANCNQAKAAMRSLDSGMRIARTNEKGEREILDDAQRADEAKRTREAMASSCK